MRVQITPGFIRASVAIDLPTPVRAALDPIQQRLAALALPLHILDSADLHLTLAFLGEILPTQISPLVDTVQRTSTAIARFDLQVAGLDMGPNPRAPTVFWACLAPQSPGLTTLLTLRQHLVALLDTHGFWVDPTFIPHITLARLHPHIPRSGREQVVTAVRALAGFPPIGFSVSAISVQSTTARPGGASYNLLAQIDLLPTPA